MKRYALFVYRKPEGGWHDFYALYDELGQAVAAGHKSKAKFHVVDLHNWVIVESNEKPALSEVEVVEDVGA